jgi:Polyketide cyclase / dehydrase and lipid transport
MPVSDYRATLAAEEEEEEEEKEGRGAQATWSTEFTPAEAREADAKTAISGFLRAGLDNLKQLHR